MEKESFDLCVIGGGPGGYVAAIKAAQQGLKTAIVEAKELGGVCLNCGCIPSKTLIANAEVLRKVRNADKFGISVGQVSFNYGEMKKRKDQVVEKIRRGLEGLIASNKIKVFKGYGKFLGPNEMKVTGNEEALFHFKKAIIATGSEPRALFQFPFDYKRIHDSTSLLELTALPKRLVIIGGGIIGSEFACMHSAFGVDVTILEVLPTIVSTEGSHVSDALTASFKKQGIKIETNAVATKVENSGSELIIHLEGGRTVTTDMILVSVGRKYNSENLGLEKVGVIVEKNGAIPINEYMETNVPGIYAIGDVTGKWILAHVASHQGMIAADNASGMRKKMHYNAVPSVIYTNPEVGTIGYTLERAIQNGYDATLGKFPFQALGKSQAIAETEGFAQIVSDKKTGEILGAQVVGYGASTLIAEMAVAIGSELTVTSISDTIHAHPTIAEAWMEAAFLAADMPLHLPPKAKKAP